MNDDQIGSIKAENETDYNKAITKNYPFYTPQTYKTNKGSFLYNQTLVNKTPEERNRVTFKDDLSDNKQRKGSNSQG